MEYDPDTRTENEAIKDHYRERHTANNNPLDPNPKRHELYSFPGKVTNTIQLYQIAVMLHDIRRMLIVGFYAIWVVGAFRGVMLLRELWKYFND